MKATHKILSLILAAVLLFSVLPLTASAEDAVPAVIGDALADAVAEDGLADTGAAPDLADTGATVVDVDITTVSQLKSNLELNDTSKVYRLNLKANISAYLGYQGDTTSSSYFPKWITVGQGTKYLNLGKYSITMYNDYSASRSFGYRGDAYVESVCRECLFSIPSGAVLYVGSSGAYGSEGGISYSGTVYAGNDGIDNRDIFHVDGGWLYVNSGKYVIPESYIKSGVRRVQINGTPVTVNSGHAVINGGFFYGRGVEKYCTKTADTIVYSERNGAVEVRGTDVYLTVNGGQFKGFGHATAFNTNGSSWYTSRVVFNTGEFDVDTTDNNQYEVKLGGYWHYYPAGVGLPITKLLANTDYYTASANHIFTQAELDSNPNAIYYLTEKLNISPTTGQASYAALNNPDGAKTIVFERGGAKITSSSAIENWNKYDSFRVGISRDSFAFQNINTAIQYRPQYDGLSETATATYTLYRVFGSLGKQTLAKDQKLTLYRGSDGNYFFDLKDLGSDVIAKMNDGIKYYLEVSMLETHTCNINTYKCTHTGTYVFKTAPTPTVSFDSNGGTPKDALAPVKVSIGSNYQLPANPYTNGGNVFEGWYIKGKESTVMPAGSTIRITGDITLVAKWRGNYRASFYGQNLDGKSTVSVHEAMYPLNSLLYLPVCDYTKTGYRFVGWHTPVDHYAKIYKVNDTFKLTINTDFLAVFDVKVTFAPNGAASTMENQWVRRGSEYTLPANGYNAAADKRFTGWKIGSKVYQPGEKVKVDEPITVTAQWETVYSKFVGSVALTITEPKAGAKPDFTVKKNTADCDFYLGYGVLAPNGTGLEFIDLSKGTPENPLLDFQYYMNKDDTFKKGQKYTARIFLSTSDKPGTAFSKTFSATVNGQKATVSDTSKGNETVAWVDYTFTVGDGKKILLGDLNGNGKVNNADYQLLARYTLGWPGAKDKIAVFEAADLNGNGKVNNADYQILARYVLGWAGYDKYIKWVEV